jgi:OOP family OmpA-OmpF porin
MWIAWLASVAVAQEGLDAHGFHFVPGDGDRLDLLSTWRPELQKPGAFGVGGLFEYAKAPLVQMSRLQPDDEPTRTVLVDNLFGLNLAGQVAVHERIAIAAALPVWFTAVGPDGAAGPALGDLRLSVPITLLAPDEDESGFAMSVIPFGDAPTGANARFLGASGFGGGLLVAPGWSAERFQLSGNVGIQATPGVAIDNLNGGAHLLASIGTAFAVSDTLGLRAEAYANPSLSANRKPGTESPSELLLSARGRYDSGLSWTAGGAMGLTKGAGAATYRLFVGMGFTRGKQPEPDTDLDGLVDSLDACPTEAETVNGYEDTEGCPDKLSNFDLTVVNQDGQPVTDATVTMGGQVYTLDGQGHARIADAIPGTDVAGSVAHPWYAVTDIPTTKLPPGDSALTVTLMYLPGKVRVITKSNSGAILDARVRFDGPEPKDPVAVGDDGQEVFELRPGQWRLLVSADAFGTERRDLEIKPGETSLVVIEVVLYPAKAEIKATEIKILDQVHFDFDKDTIMADSFPLLVEVANILLDHPEVAKIEVQGHTDSKGNDAYNLELSQRRVDTVRQFLIDKGVAAERLVAVGYGETLPIAPNTNEKGRAANRRVQFVIVNPELTPGVQNAPETPPTTP